MMEKEVKDPIDQDLETEALELILFHVSECYVYLIPPRISAASYRADEWNVNKWAWEGMLKVVSKGEDCIIKLEDKNTGELYARAFLRNGEPHPVETVIDSSRYFVLRIEENIDGRLRHAFIGLGFRERTEAYDFQAALHDHMKYLNKKKTAEEMEQHFQSASSVDYSLKEGETLVLQLNNKGGKSKILEQGIHSLSLEEKSQQKEPVLSIKLPPPPPAPVSPVTSLKSSVNVPPKISLDGNSKENSPRPTKEEQKEQPSPKNESKEEEVEEIPDDDFGDFQAAIKD